MVTCTHKRLMNCGVLLALFTTSATAGSLTAIRVASGLARPVHAVAAPGDSLRLFVVEQGGRIRILKDDELQRDPFLTVSVRCCGESGLLGLAFHPDYDDNGLFYVNYSDRNNGATIIAQFKVSDDPDVADPNSQKRLLTISQPFGNHNGGWIGFGPDGYLYIGMGDGGSGGDPFDNAQNLKKLLGKMLRIDVDKDDFPRDPNRNYGIPKDNPFVNDPDALNEIWALGLRNPWRAGFDRKTGDLYIGDVGQSAKEEVNFQSGSSKGGENYGWRCMEGNNCFRQSQGCTCNQENLSDPIHDYGRGDGTTVTGGYVYRGSRIPGLDGTYFFADYGRSRIWSLRYDGEEVTEFTERTTELKPRDGTRINSISSFGEGHGGELYICDLGGELFKIISNAPPCETVRRFSARCNRRGKVKAVVKFKNSEQEGQTVTIGIDDDIFAVDVKRKKAKLTQCCSQGETTVSLIEPRECKSPKVVDCP